MRMTLNDWIGLTGVAILLIAYLLNLVGKLDQKSLAYILLNIIGAALACLAAFLIHYFPFVILEGTWTFVSVVALIKLIIKNRSK